MAEMTSEASYILIPEPTITWRHQYNFLFFFYRVAFFAGLGYTIVLPTIYTYIEKQ
jgi:hypothetical protein